MLKKHSLNALQKALNKTLSLDERMPAQIQALQGKVLELIISPLNVNFFILFDQGIVHLLDRYEGVPDTVIRSNPLGLIRLSILPAHKARSLFNDTIHLSGDIELGQRVKKLFDELDIDWEGHLAHFTGDVVAYQIGSLVRKGKAFGTQLSQSMQENFSEYLQEEAGVLPSQNELDDFYNQVDELSLRVERMDAYVKQLLAAN